MAGDRLARLGGDQLTHFADSTGTRIAYDTVGEGPDIVFLHAGIADRTMWEPQVEQFGDRFRVTTPDARGFGESTFGDGPFSRRDDWAAVLDAIGSETATFVGCSIGAGFALDFALEHPQRLDKLVLVGVTPAGFPGEDDPFLTEMWPIVDAAIERGNYEEAGRLEARMWVDGKRPEGTSPQWLREQVVEWSIPINKTDWASTADRSLQLDPLAFHRLADVTVPTLVVVGEADADVVREGCRATAAAIPGAQLIELAGTAHLPNLEVPEAFNAALEAFLAR